MTRTYASSRYSQLCDYTHYHAGQDGIKRSVEQRRHPSSRPARASTTADIGHRLCPPTLRHPSIRSAGTSTTVSPVRRNFDNRQPRPQKCPPMDRIRSCRSFGSVRGAHRTGVSGGIFFEFSTILMILEIWLTLFSNCRRFSAWGSCGREPNAVIHLVIALWFMIMFKAGSDNCRQFDFFARRGPKKSKIVGFSKKVITIRTG